MYICMHVGSVRTYLIAHNFNRMTLDKTMWEHSRAIKGMTKSFPVAKGDGRDGTTKCLAHGNRLTPSSFLCVHVRIHMPIETFYVT